MCQTLSKQLEHAGFGALHRRFPFLASAITFISVSYFKKMYIQFDSLEPADSTILASSLFTITDPGTEVSILMLFLVHLDQRSR
jgi:hypothetical protein